MDLEISLALFQQKPTRLELCEYIRKITKCNHSRKTRRRRRR
jgi:hypothetical protein